MLNFGDIWYVGGARAKGWHAEFWAYHMLIKNRYLIFIIYFENCLESFLECSTHTLYLVYGYRVGPKVHMVRRITGARLR